MRPSTIPPPPFAKACGCGQVHDRSAWAALPALPDWNFGDAVLELRNCPCGSTLAIEVTR